LEAIARTDPQFYRYIQFLGLCDYPVTIFIASCERSLSTLRRLKTWVRNSMGEERLTGSAMIYRDIHLDVNDIIDSFASKKRKILFVLYL